MVYLMYTGVDRLLPESAVLSSIGCIAPGQAFLPGREEDWNSQAEDWVPSTQRARRYDLWARIGRRLWTQVSDRLRGTIVPEPGPASWLDLPGGYGGAVPVRPRVGQGVFRNGFRSSGYAPSASAGSECAVFDARKCAALNAH